MEAFAAFVAVRTGTFAAGQEGGLGCGAVEAMVETGLVAEADVWETHAAVLAVVVGTAEGVRRDGWQNKAAVEAVFGDIFDFRFSILDWGDFSDGV